MEMTAKGWVYLWLSSVLFLVGMVLADEAGCGWCTSTTCYGPGHCGPACVCVMPPGSTSGRCYSIEVPDAQ
jgi:hypothetical protein